MTSKISKEEWVDRIDDYRKSGFSITRYCQENNLKASTFRYWLKKNEKLSNSTESKLVKISVPLKSNQKIKLIFNQVTVEFPAELATDKISILISALKEI